jgi:hypothetical protein
VVTDCRALSFFRSVKNISVKIEKWLSYISSFDITFEHRPGTKLVVPDALSRDERFESELPLTPTVHRVIATPTDTVGLSQTQIKKEQQESRHSRQIFDFLSGKVVNPVKLKQLAKDAEGFTISGGVLCKAPSPGKFGTARPYIPFKLRSDVLKACHSDPLAGHQGVSKTQSRIALRYYWPGMNEDVANYVAKCTSCNLNKKLGKKFKSSVEPLKLKTPWSQVQADFICRTDGGQLSQTRP